MCGLSPCSECIDSCLNCRAPERAWKMAKGRNVSRRNRTMMYAGSGMAIGAALGLLFGLLLFENMIWGLIIGVLAGLVVGAIVDAKGSL